MRSAIFTTCLLAALTALPVRAEQTDSRGGGQPFDNTQPSIALNYLVRTSGLAQELGEVILFAGNFEPPGWEFADGELLSTSQHPVLFDLLGTTYGGDGVSTFALPDLRGRTPIGFGQGQGLSNHTLGAASGASSVTLTLDQMAAHDHTLPFGGTTSSSGGDQPYGNMQPSLAMNYVVAATRGIYPPLPDMVGDVAPLAGILEPYLGAVGLFAGPNLPNGFLPADGGLQNIALNTALFSLLGTTYGGNGQTNFALPDLRGRAPVGRGEAPGLAPMLLGETTGTETETLLESQLPPHLHGLPPGADTTGITGGAQPVNNVQPSLGLNYIIAMQGIFPPRPDAPDEALPLIAGLDPYLGTIELFASNFAPRGWAFAHGQLLSIAQNTALFALLGTTYGGDGVTTFALPDLRGRVAVGAGQGPGLPNWQLGQTSGSEFVTLTLNNLPPHTHDYVVPEPSGLVLAVLGLVGLGAWAWRSRKR